MAPNVSKGSPMVIKLDDLSGMSFPRSPTIISSANGLE